MGPEDQEFEETEAAACLAETQGQASAVFSVAADKLQSLTSGRGRSDGPPRFAAKSNGKGRGKTRRPLVARQTAPQ